MSELYVRRKMVSSLVDRMVIEEDVSVRELVGRLEFPDELETYLNVSIEGEYIPRDQWHNRIATNKDIVRVSVVPGKKVLPVIAAIALVVVGNVAGAAVAGAIFGSGAIAAGSVAAIATSAVVSAAVVFVGSLAIGALFPPPPPVPLPTFEAIGSYSSITSAGGGGGGYAATSSQGCGGGGGPDFHSASGIRNAVRSYSAVRNIYGTHKVAPDSAAENLIVTTGFTQTLYSLFDFGYGEVELNDIRIGSTPIDRYTEVDYVVHTHYKNQDLDFYKNDHSTAGVNAEIRYAWIIRNTPSKFSDEVVIDLGFPIGLFKYDRIGGNFLTMSADFDIRFKDVATGLSHSLYTNRFVKSSLSTTRYYNSIRVTRAVKEPFIVSVSVGLPHAGEWEISIKRSDTVLYEREGNNQYNDKTMFASIRSITYQKPLDFDVEHTVMELRLTASDQLNGSIDAITAIASRKLPTWNAGVWGPNVKTSNPAWIALDILRGDANPRALKDDRIDLQSFKDWADFCDRNSPQGDTYYQCDANWDGSSTVFDRLRDVMSTARATISIRENKYAAVFESFPTIPVQMFTPRNSSGFNASKIFPKIPHGLKMTFTDPDSDWQVMDVIVYADGYDITNADYFENMSLPLCTRSDQAWRDGRYFLAQGILRPEEFIINVDVENLLCERGDLVSVQYDVAKAGGLPVRASAINGTEVTFTDEVFWDATEEYYIRFRYQDGVQEEIKIISQPDTQTVELENAPVDANVGDLCIFGKKNFIIDEFLVKTVIPSSNLGATLTMVPIAREIADADKGVIPPYIPPIADNSATPTCVPVSITSAMFYKDRQPYVDVFITWEETTAGLFYEIWKARDGNYQLMGTVTGQSFHLWNAQSTLDPEYPSGETIDVVVMPINSLGYKPAFGECPVNSFTAIHDVTPPGKPLFLSGNINKQIMYLSWLPPLDEDIGGYILKFSSDLSSPDWHRSTIETHLLPHDSSSVEINARIGSYLLKTIDTSGNQSKEAAIVRTTIPSLDWLNVVEKVVEDPAFSGAYDSIVKVGDGVRLDRRPVMPASVITIDKDAYAVPATGYFDVGTYAFHKVVDIGEIATSRVVANLSAYGAEDIYIASWPTMAAINPIAATREGDWDVEVQIRTADTAALLNDAGWQRVTAGYYTGRFYEFRVVLTTIDSHVSPHVYELSVEVDMDDRIVSDNDVSSLLGGGRYHFTGGYFISIPSIAITGQNMSLGDYFTVSNVSQDGFDIEFYDSLGASIVRQYDILAKGYGQVTSTSLPAVLKKDEDDIHLLPAGIRHTRLPGILH